MEKLVESWGVILLTLYFSMALGQGGGGGGNNYAKHMSFPYINPTECKILAFSGFWHLGRERFTNL